MRTITKVPIEMNGLFLASNEGTEAIGNKALIKVNHMNNQIIFEVELCFTGSSTSKAAASVAFIISK